LLELFADAVEGFKDETHQGALHSEQLGKGGFEKLGDGSRSGVVKNPGKALCAATCPCEAGAPRPPSAALGPQGAGGCWGASLAPCVRFLTPSLPSPGSSSEKASLASAPEPPCSGEVCRGLLPGKRCLVVSV